MSGERRTGSFATMDVLEASVPRKGAHHAVYGAAHRPRHARRRVSTVAPASLAAAFADVPAVPPNDRDDTELFPGCDGVHDASTSIQQV